MSCQFCEDWCQLCTSEVLLFSNLPVKEQVKLSQIASHYPFKKGEHLFLEGDQADSLRIVLEGQVKLHNYDIDGKEQIYDIIEAGETIGEDLFLEEGANYPYAASCNTDGQVCEIEKGRFLEILHEKPEIALSMIGSLSRKLQHANERVEMLQENDAGMRLATFFYNRCKRKDNGVINLNVDDIAGSVNLRRETVSRKIQELQELGLVQRLGQGKIKVLDMNNLRRYARGELDLAKEKV